MTTASYSNSNVILNCKYCGDEITFDSARVSKNGKLIPLDPNRHNTPSPHQCRARPSLGHTDMFACHNCKQRGHLSIRPFISKHVHIHFI